MAEKRYISVEEARQNFLSGEEVWYELEDDFDEDGEQMATCVGLSYGDTLEDVYSNRKYFTTD